MGSILDIKCKAKQIKMTCSKLDRPPLLFKQCILRITFFFQEQVSERMHNFQETQLTQLTWFLEILVDPTNLISKKSSWFNWHDL
jgi:hypothetical protein